jgi:hypothetical protein
VKSAVLTLPIQDGRVFQQHDQYQSPNPAKCDKQTASRCCFPGDSRIKIEPELHFIRHRVVQGLLEGWCTRLDWIPCFIFTTQDVTLAAPILGDLHIVLVEFDPNKVTPQFQSHFSSRLILCGGEGPSERGVRRFIATSPSTRKRLRERDRSDPDSSNRARRGRTR